MQWLERCDGRREPIAHKRERRWRVGWRQKHHNIGLSSSAEWGFERTETTAPYRPAVVRSKTDLEAPGTVVAITSAPMRALDAIRPNGAGVMERVFGLSESQIARRVKTIAKAAGLADWEFFSGHSGRVGMARRMAQNGAPTHEIERQGRWKQGGGMVGRYNPRRICRVGTVLPVATQL